MIGCSKDNTVPQAYIWDQFQVLRKKKSISTWTTWGLFVNVSYYTKQTNPEQKLLILLECTQNSEALHRRMLHKMTINPKERNDFVALHSNRVYIGYSDWLFIDYSLIFSLNSFNYERSSWCHDRLHHSGIFCCVSRDSYSAILRYYTQNR